MPNLRGPTERKRQLYANVLASIILYAAPVWAHKASKKGKIQNILRKLHRNISQRVIAAYKTTSEDAAAILSRIPSYQITMEGRRRAYEEIRDCKINKTWSKKKDREITVREKLRGYGIWKKYLEERSKAGVT